MLRSKRHQGEDTWGKGKTWSHACVSVLEEKEKVDKKSSGQGRGEEIKMAQDHEMWERGKLQCVESSQLYQD